MASSAEQSPASPISSDNTSLQLEERVAVPALSDIIGPKTGNSKYVALRQIGAGANGKAFLVRNRTTSELFVAKLVDLSSLDARTKRNALTEQRIQASVTHFAIARLIEHYHLSDDVLLHIVELGEAGDLASIIKQRTKDAQYFQEHEAAFLVVQLVLAVDALHRRRIMHRDIKSANVFVKMNGLLKLGDFGFSHQYDNTISADMAGTLCGTPAYIPPEMWHRQPYNKRADVWSLGVLCYELLALKKPFAAETVAKLGEVICEGKIPPLPAHFSDAFGDVVFRMLEPNASRRWTTSQLLAHPFLQNTLSAFVDAVRVQPLISDAHRDEISATVDDLRRDLSAIIALGGSACSPGASAESQSLSTSLERSQRSHRANSDAASPRGSTTAAVGAGGGGAGSNRDDPSNGLSTTTAPTSTAANNTTTNNTNNPEPFWDMYKHSATEGWKRRVLRLTARGDISVEVIGQPSKRKALQLVHVIGIRKRSVSDYVSSLGVAAPPPAALTDLDEFGVELRLGNSTSVFFVAMSLRDQVECVKVLNDARMALAKESSKDDK